MHKNFVRGALLAGTALSFIAPTFAQEAEEFTLEEIVVTAQKREQSLQDVPMSISAVSASTLRDAGTISMEGVANMVPSLTTTQNISPINQSYRVRGIGSDPNIPTFEPDVALFIDGVYMPRSGLGVDDLVDLARVEVLKGPQSTLYGKNATAGVVNVVSAGPSNTFGAHFDASLSNIEGAKDALAYRLAGSVTGPITEGIRGRLTGVWYDKGHTYKNLTPNAGDANDLKRYAVRGQVEFDLNSSTQLNLTAARTQVLNSDMTNADVYLADASAALDAAGGACPNNDPMDRIICTSAPNQYKATTNMASATLTSDFDFAKLTSISAWSNYTSETVATDIDQVSLPLVTYDDHQRGSAFSQELRLVSPTGEKLEWLVGGYYLHNKYNRGDHGNTPMFTMQAAAPAVPLPLPTATAAQLAPLFGGLAQLGGMGLIDLHGAATPAQIQNQLTLGQAGDLGYIDSTAKSDYYAGFAQVTYHFSDQFSLTGGFRLATEKKTASLNNAYTTAANPYFANILGQLQTLNTTLAALPDGHPLKTALTPLMPGLIGGTTMVAGTNLLSASLVPTGVNGALPEDKHTVPTFTVTGNYTPNDNTLFYLTMARGAKSGGHNIGFGNATPNQRPFGSERASHYEIGTKLDLLDKKARIAVSGFHTVYTDFQNAGFVGLQFLVNNAEKVVVNGVEFDGAFAIARGLTLNTGATWLNAKYVEYNGGACLPAGVTGVEATSACSFSGEKLPLTPALRATAGLQYDHSLGEGSVYGRVDLNWQSTTITNTANLDRRSEQDPYALVNLRFGYRMDNGFDIAIWANNLFDQNYVQQGAVLNLFSQSAGYQNFLGNPREVGLTLRKDF